jgi:hypothetical protein
MESAALICVARIRMARICFLKVDQIENFELCTEFIRQLNMQKRIVSESDIFSIINGGFGCQDTFLRGWRGFWPK